jgi:hypothetical protein
MLGPPAVYNTAGQGENHTFSQKRHPADVRPFVVISLLRFSFVTTIIGKPIISGKP